MRVCLIVSLMHRKQNDTIIVQTFDLVNRILLSFSIKSHQYVKTMELLYIWIEDYKNIHHQGFNFSPKYRFEFKPTKYQDEANKNNVTEGELFQLDQNGNRISKESSTSNQDNSIYENFFEPSQDIKDAWKEREDGLENSIHLGTITNIAAVIGANGAGKSNLLEFIRTEVLTQVIENRGSKKFVIVFEVENNKNIFSSNNIAITKKPQALQFYVKNEDEKDPHIIYYSKYLNLIRTEILGGKNSTSVSFESLYTRRFDGQTQSSITNDYLQRQLDFIQSNENGKFLHIPFSLPEKLEVAIYCSKIPEFLKFYEESYDSEKKISIFLENFYLTYLSKVSFDGKHGLIHIIKVLQVQRIIELLLESSFPKETIWELVKINLSEPDPNKFYISFIKSIEAFIENPNNKSENAMNQAAPTSIRFFLINSKELIDLIAQDWLSILTDSEFDNSINNNLEDPALIYRKDYPIKTFLKTFETYKKTRWQFWDLSWVGLSSGEDALLNIYSSFPFFKKNNASPLLVRISNSFIILIDEGESGFHPEWQRNYLKYLIDFFPQIYPNKQIQIILTTHSPFLASDLPKENIIFLEKGKEGQKFPDGTDANGKCIVVDGLKDKKQTFGANIHTLLSDSFFLEKGLIGEFAKGKINEVIKIMGHELKKRNLNLRLENAKRLNLEKDIKNTNKEIEELKQEKEKNKIKNFADEKDGIKKLIDIIGEPIVQDKLLQMYFSIESEDEKEAQIKFHEEKIKRLKQL